MAQRIVRAKAKIRDARIPYQVPVARRPAGSPRHRAHVIYLVFNEGYSASSGASLTRHDLSAEAIRLGRLLVELLPEPEAVGLLALMLLHESRRAARTSRTGELVLLDDQDRSLMGSRADRRRLRAGRAGADVAAVRPVHAAGGDRGRPRRSADAGRDRLGADRRPVRRAAARRSVAGRRIESRRGRRHARWPATPASRSSTRFSPAATRGLSARALGARRPVPAAGEEREARASYERALALTRQEPERRFLERRLRELET